MEKHPGGLPRVPVFPITPASRVTKPEACSTYCNCRVLATNCCQRMYLATSAPDGCTYRVVVWMLRCPRAA